jgi:hypothetical protein
MSRRSRTVLMVFAGIGVFLFLFGSFEYVSYTQTTASFSGVQFVSVTFKNSTSSSLVSQALNVYNFVVSPSTEHVISLLINTVESVNLNLTLTFDNYGILPVYVLSETHQLFANGNLIGVGSSSGFWVPAGGSVHQSIRENIQTGELESLVRSALYSGGSVKFVLVGSASLSIGSFPFSLQSSANLLNYLAQKLGIPLPA